MNGISPVYFASVAPQFSSSTDPAPLTPEVNSALYGINGLTSALANGHSGYVDEVFGRALDAARTHRDAFEILLVVVQGAIEKEKNFPRGVDAATKLRDQQATARQTKELSGRVFEKLQELEL